MMQSLSNTVNGEIEQGEPAAPGEQLLEREGGKKERAPQKQGIETEIWARFSSKSLGVRNKARSPLQWLWTDADGTRLLISQQTLCLRVKEIWDS